MTMQQQGQERNAADLHIPVLMKETLAALQPLDRDEEALELARRRLEPFGGRVHTYHCRYSQFEEALDDLGWDKVDAVLLDIGVSSLQLDEAEFELIQRARRGECLYKCGMERYHLEVKAPTHKAVLFGSAGGR